MITNYEQYLNLIKEGLIRTHNIIQYESSLRLKLYKNFEYELVIESKFKFSIKFFNVNNTDQQQLNMILPIINTFGYFPSYIKIELPNGMVKGFKFDKKYISNRYKSFEILFEAKYEDGLYMNDLPIPEKCYHLTKQIYKDKIENYGLYPKSKNRKGNHLERIYLFYNVDNYIRLLESLKLNDLLNNDEKDKNEKNNDTGEYMLLEIKLPSDIIIHTDPNYSDGFYTTDNIPFKYITILKTNL